MKASFTDFKLSLGITSPTRDTEYAYILKGLIKELYSVYGIAISKDVFSNSETINATYDTTVQLAYKNIIEVTIAGFSEGIDYTIDLVTGELVVLQSGSMLENTDYTITYTYYLFINESNEIIYTIYPTEDDTTYKVDVSPVELKRVEYDGNTLVEDSDYYFYNRTFEPNVTITSYRKPFKLYLEAGFDTMPFDLKQAFYELAQIRFDFREAKAYLVDKTTDNSQGVSTTYSKDNIPKHIENILLAYSGRRFIV